jgi:hypothetical protein
MKALRTFLAVSEEEAYAKFKRKQRAKGGQKGEGVKATLAKKKPKKLTLKKVLDSSSASTPQQGGGASGGTGGVDGLLPSDWSSIEAGPSLMPKKKYSDLSGFEAPYTDPKTRLRYASVEEYKNVKAMTYERVQATLAVRGANVVFK